MVAGETIFREGIVPKEVEVLRFNTRFNQIVEARSVGEGWTEISVPAGVLEPLSKEQEATCRDALNEAFGRTVDIKSIGKGVGGQSNKLFIELDVKEDLAGSVVSTQSLVIVF